MKFLEGILAAVPQGKALFWIVIGAITTFGAGFGMAFGVGDAQNNLALIPEMSETITEHTSRISNLEDSVSSASTQRRRIICIGRIAATGETLPAFELDARCP